MRRALLLLLALLLPLKAIGAVVVPITGTPHHQHAQHDHELVTQAGSAHGVHQSPHQHAGAHPVCEVMAQSVDAHEGTLHEHACPHLGMATLVPARARLEAPSVPPYVEDHAAVPFTSVVLDVIVPPPTLIS